MLSSARVALAFRGILWALLCALTACWNGGSGSAAIVHLEELELRLERLESRAALGDQEMAGFLAASREDLARARELIIESDVGRAQEIMDRLDAGLTERERLLPKPREEVGNLHGLVEFRRENDSVWRTYTESRGLAEVETLRTGVRSAAVFQLPVGGDLALQSETEMEVVRYGGGQVRVRLIKGAWTYQREAEGGGEAIFDMDRFQVRVAGKASFEMAKQIIMDQRCFSLFEGEAAWNELGDGGALSGGSGMVWTEGARQEIRLPPAPTIDPRDREIEAYAGDAREATVKLRWYTSTGGTNCQVQVSSHPSFVTRVFDRMGVRIGSVAADLLPGEYWWRVRGFAPENAPGPFAEVGVILVREGDPNQAEQGPPPGQPPLDNIEVEVIHTMAIVSGRTDDHARVRVNGAPAVMMDDGRFRAIVNFDRAGNHRVHIVAINMNTGGETETERVVLIQE